MIRVLVDGRIAGDDGIGRYTRCLTGALHSQARRSQAMGSGAGHDLRIEVLPPTGTRRYSRAEGTELLRAAHASDAQLVHVLDYRVPIEEAGVPMMVTIHDVLRLVSPRFCYTDAEFATRFGSDGLAELAATTAALHEIAELPSGVMRRPRSLHEDFYARMLALACARAAGIVTPTRAVAAQLRAAVGHGSGVRVSPWGTDHLWACEPPTGQPPTGQPPTGGAARVAGRYLLYVGQSRAHKGLDTLLAAYERSAASAAGVRLVCVGADFADGAKGAALVSARLNQAVVTLGRVSDTSLRALYAHADALVHVAEHEGFGFTPLEALAAGTRVVASDIPVLREILADHAAFADHTDPDSVATAINAVISAPDEPVARNRRVRWARRYRWSEHADDVLALYADALR